MPDHKANPYPQTQISWIRRLWRGFWQLVDQFLMIFSLQTLDDSVAARLRRLRYLYYHDPNVTVSYRRVRDVLRGQVSPQHYAYYDRLMQAERVMFQAGLNLPAHLDGEAWLADMQHLGTKIAQLIEQLEETQALMKLYAEGSDLAHQAATLNATLANEIDSALDLHASLPAQLMALKLETSSHVIRRNRERVQRLSEEWDEVDHGAVTPHDLRQIMASDGELPAKE